MTAHIPLVYRPIFERDFTYFVFYGGRGGGKSENIAQSLVLLSLREPLRILCIRESQNSLEESVKALIEKWIVNLGLFGYFKVKHNSIEGNNGSSFLFLGMKSHNAVSVKSISNINVTWIEEAEAFSKRSWSLLVPSVTRTPNAKIIISFNPYRAEDIIYQDFIVNSPPAKSYVRKVNYTDNPFFKGSPLEEVMLDDRQRLKKSEFEHKWLGNLAVFNEESLFSGVNFQSFEAPIEFTSVVIACDPATTNTEFSNEYGIIVLGLAFDARAYVLADKSGHKTPAQFAKDVALLYQVYRATTVVVEVNNGGDFIKTVLLNENPLMKIAEVRAEHDKVNRAAPIASLFSLGKIRLTDEFPELRRQAFNLTNRGYMGVKGESPDRLDALVWGIYFLFNLSLKETEFSVFDLSWFAFEPSYEANYRELSGSIRYVRHFGVYVTELLFILCKENTDTRLKIIDATIKEAGDVVGDDKLTFIADNVGSDFLRLEFPSFKSYTPLKINTKFDVFLPPLLDVFKQKKVALCKDMPNREFDRFLGNLLKKQLAEFSYESQKEFLLIRLLADLCYNNFELNTEGL